MSEIRDVDYEIAPVLKAVHAYAEAVANAGKKRGAPPAMKDRWDALVSTLHAYGSWRFYEGGDYVFIDRKDTKITKRGWLEETERLKAEYFTGRPAEGSEQR